MLKSKPGAWIEVAHNTLFTISQGACCYKFHTPYARTVDVQKRHVKQLNKIRKKYLVYCLCFAGANHKGKYTSCAKRKKSKPCASTIKPCIDSQ